MPQGAAPCPRLRCHCKICVFDSQTTLSRTEQLSAEGTEELAEYWNSWWLLLPHTSPWAVSALWDVFADTPWPMLCAQRNIQSKQNYNKFMTQTVVRFY